MRSFLAFIPFLAATGALASHGRSSHHAHIARQANSNLISEIANECQTLCLPFPTTINTCTSNNPQSDADIAKCTCTDVTYTQLKACTDCVAAAGGVLSGAHLDTVQQVQAGFTSFATACEQQGFPVSIVVPPPPTNSLTSGGSGSGSSGNSSSKQGSDSSDSNSGDNFLVANAGDSDSFDNGSPSTGAAGRSVDVYQQSRMVALVGAIVGTAVAIL